MIVESIEPYGLNIKTRAQNKPMFSKIGVVGAGKEGRNIIVLTASAGMEVVFMDESEERNQYVLNEIEKTLDKKVNNWGLTPAEKKVILNRIVPTLDYQAFKGCDLVIEATRYSETGRRSTPVRKGIFKKLEETLEKDAIIATNGSVVIISELSSELEYKDRCVSLYFPVGHPDAKILEIVSGMHTSEEVYNRMIIFSKMIGYEPHRISESNGNVSLRLMVTMLNQACEILMERVTSMKSIEETFTVIYGQRYGIFRLADIIGIERLVTLMESLFNDFGEKHFKPNPILWKLYRSNQVGVRTKKGFYIYDDNKNPIAENTSLFN